MEILLLIGGIVFIAVICVLLIMIAKIIEIIINKTFKKYFSIKKIFIILLIIGVLIIPAINLVKIINGRINEMIVNTNYKNQTYIKIDDNTLINEFIDNGSSMDNKLKGKIILLNGKISETARPRDNIPVVDSSCIYFGDVYNDTYMPAIACYFNDIVVDKLKEGEIISVIGKYRKYELYYNNMKRIIIGDCKIVEE